LKWKRGLTDHYIGTDDLMYSVSKNAVSKDVSPTGFRYAAHRIGRQEPLGVFDTGDEAKKCCEDDARMKK